MPWVSEVNTASPRAMAVLTSETHGMAQRGGSVVSHLKVGDFRSPLIRSGSADGFLGLKAESLDLHGHFTRAQGWRIVNSDRARPSAAVVDADAIAGEIDNPRAVNLVVLGYALAWGAHRDAASGGLFCTRDDIRQVLAVRLEQRPEMRAASLKALDAGYASGAT